MESLADTAGLIGHSGLVKDVVRCLRDDTGSGAIITGSAGSGKTAVSRAVLQELRLRGKTIRLPATRSLAAVPFGALAPYLAGLPDHELDSYAAVLAELTGSLRSEPARPLFVIDDAQCLDRGTTQLLARAVATGAARLLATSQPGAMIPEEFLALWEDGILAKFDLAPLSRVGVHQFCEQVLRADVSPWVSALFYDLADGNPLMLRSLLEHSRVSGALGLRHGVWFLLTAPDLAAVPAADVVDLQLRFLTPEEKTAAALIALAGPLSLGQLLRFSSPKAVDALETAGLISVSRGHERIVRPANRFVGEIIRRRVPAGRSADLRSSILALPLADAARPETLLNRLRWSLDCGASVPPGELLAAAVSSNVALDAAAAARAAGAVRDEAFLPDARVQLAYAHFILGRPEAAAGYLKSARPLRYGRPTYLAALLAARLGIPAAPPELPREAAQGSGDEAGPAPDGPRWTQSPAAGMAAALLGTSWDGQFPAFEARVRELADAAAAIPEIRIPALSLLAELWTAQGRLLPGLRLDREAWQSAQGATMALPLVYEDLLERHCLNLIRAADWDGLAAVLDNYAACHPARLLFSGGMLHLMRGFARLRQGRMPESRAELLLGVEELLIADPLNVLPFAHSAAAYAAAAVGRPREADEQAQAFRRSVYREPRTLRLLAGAYCSAAELATGIDRGGRNGLVQLADEAGEQGLRGVETDIRRLALRSGDTGSAPALAASSSAVQGPEARLLEAFARAVAAADVAGLIGISDDALDAGHLLLALEAAQQAAAVLEHAPEGRRHTAVQRRVHHRLVAAGMSGHLDIVRGEAGSGLTVREAAILDLVSGGSTNADIAIGLGISQRTVEGHLSRILAKLGLTRRLELLDRTRHS